MPDKPNHEAQELRRELEHERNKREWQPIATMPKDSSEVLGYTPLGFYDVIIHLNGAVIDSDGMPSGATHWMPLPDPPKEKP